MMEAWKLLSLNFHSSSSLHSFHHRITEFNLLSDKIVRFSSGLTWINRRDPEALQKDSSFLSFSVKRRDLGVKRDYLKLTKIYGTRHLIHFHFRFQETLPSLWNKIQIK